MSENAGSIYYTVDIETDKTLRAQQKIDAGFDTLQKGMDKTDQQATKLGGGLNRLSAAIGAVVAASALRDLAGLVQKYQEMSERVQMATDSQDEFEMVQKRLLNTANATYRSLGEAQELYIRTADSLRSIGYTTAQALDVTDSLSFAFVKNATSVERADGAISALSKSINKGRVEADAWETLIAAAPTIIDDIAASSGKTAAEIRQLGAEGKLTATALTEGLRQSLDENSRAAAGMAANLTDAGVRTRTAITQVLVSLEAQTGALQAVTDGVIGAANAMLEFGADSEKMASFLNGATTAASALAAVIAGRLLTSATAYSAALLKQAAASVAAARAADANLRLAEAEAVAAANALMQARASAAATTGLSTHAAAATALVAAEGRATIATTALTAATTTAAAASRVGSAAMIGLRTAMGFLGGPAGVILLAATALYSFVGTAEDAKPKTDALTESVDALGTAAERATERFKRLTTGIAELNKTELTVRKGDLEDQLANAEKQLKAFERQFERGVGTVGQVEGAKAAVDELRGALEKLNSTSEKSPVSSAISTDETKQKKAKKPAKTEAEKAADDIKAQVAALELQSETLGMTSSELELYKLQLAGATDEQIRAAQSSLTLIDAYKQQTDAEEEMQKRREAFGANPAATITGTVTPLQGGGFDDQTARYEAERVAEEQRYADQLERLRLAKEAEVVLLGGYQQLEQQMAQTHADRLVQIEQAKSQVMVQNGEALFTNLADAARTYQGESSGVYKALFAASKVFSIAQATMAIQTGIAMAAANPWPTNLAAMASVAAATAGLISNISSISMSGKAVGGPVQAGQMYRVNEGGKPEIFNAANGQQYMMPNQRGEVVSNKDAQGGDSGTVVNVTVMQSTEKAGTVERRTDGNTEAIDIFVADIGGGGPASRTLEQTYGLRRQGR